MCKNAGNLYGTFEDERFVTINQRIELLKKAINGADDDTKARLQTDITALKEDIRILNGEKPSGFPNTKNIKQVKSQYIALPRNTSFN